MRVVFPTKISSSLVMAALGRGSSRSAPAGARTARAGAPPRGHFRERRGSAPGARSHFRDGPLPGQSGWGGSCGGRGGSGGAPRSPPPLPLPLPRPGQPPDPGTLPRQPSAPHPASSAPVKPSLACVLHVGVEGSILIFFLLLCVNVCSRPPKPLAGRPSVPPAAKHRSREGTLLPCVCLFV